MDQVLKDLRSFVAYRVREGFEPEGEIVENATHYAQETHGREDLQPEIAQITAELMAAHRAEQAGWDTPTDCDRLDEAFAALNRQGIVARQGFSCCTNCGHTDIWDEIAKEEETHPVEGYVFYHCQCTERAIESGQLLLAYGSVEDDEAALSSVATKVVAELRQVGLGAKWRGTCGDPIVVDKLVWRRRR
jgi:hypothetical protein